MKKIHICIYLLLISSFFWCSQFQETPPEKSKVENISHPQIPEELMLWEETIQQENDPDKAQEIVPEDYEANEIIEWKSKSDISPEILEEEIKKDTKKIPAVPADTAPELEE